jgi:acylphosphatase
MKVCKRVLYAGAVQGVGFRYTTRSLAQGFAVAGFVRNLEGGQVELEAEGDAAEIDRFLEAIGRYFAENIAARQVFDVALHGYDGFEIRH